MTFNTHFYRKKYSSVWKSNCRKWCRFINRKTVIWLSREIYCSTKHTIHWSINPQTYIYIYFLSIRAFICIYMRKNSYKHDWIITFTMPLRYYWGTRTKTLCNQCYQETRNHSFQQISTYNIRHLPLIGLQSYSTLKTTQPL